MSKWVVGPSKTNVIERERCPSVSSIGSRGLFSFVGAAQCGPGQLSAGNVHVVAGSHDVNVWPFSTSTFVPPEARRYSLKPFTCTIFWASTSKSEKIKPGSVTFAPVVLS